MSKSHHSPWLAALALMAVAAAACSTNSPTASPTTIAPRSTTTTAAMTRAAAAARYLAIVKPYNAALIRFRDQANAWSASLTNAQAVAEAQPVIAETTTTDNQLLALAQLYPLAAPDIKAEVAASSAASGDLGGLATLNLLDASSWQSQVSHDASVMAGAAATVRSDLGLPAAG